jgi:SAM-dependent methyltransferase
MSENKYDTLARFYDDVIGRTFDSNGYIIDVLDEMGVRPGAKVLELGCGTGSILNDLRHRYNVTGMDISAEMIKIARKKVPQGKFYEGDIRNFSLNERFDAVLCIYDTINHIVSFSDWKKIFRNVYEHLNERGVFIFDVNTINKLEYLAFIKTYFYEFGKNYLVINVKKLKKNIYSWELNIFENIKGDNYKLVKEEVPEAVFKINDIKAELKKNFIVKRTFTETTDKPSDNSDRVYFVCRKK